jgi:hypothetical protein
MPPLVSTLPFGTHAGITENENGVSSALGVYPNPCTTQLTLVFYNSRQQVLSFRIIDIEGKNISEISAQGFSKGVHCQNINTTVLNSGIYFIVAENPNGIEIKARFIKQ